MMPFVKRHLRTIRLGVSGLFMGAGSYMVWTIPGESESERALGASAGAAMIVVGWAVHPGSLGDPHVHPRDQRGLIGGMMHDSFGTTEGRAWSAIRVMSTSCIPAARTAIQGSDDAFAYLSSACTMFGYMADRAWGNFRVHRVHPLDGNWHANLAWLLNFMLGNLLDVSAIMMGMGFKYAVNTALTGTNATEQEWNDTNRKTLVALLMGSFFSQLVTMYIASGANRDSVMARMAGHCLRLVARCGGRLIYTRDGLTLFLDTVQDGLGAFSMHRWPESTANSFYKGLLTDEGKTVFQNPEYKDAKALRNRSVSMADMFHEKNILPVNFHGYRPPPVPVTSDMKHLPASRTGNNSDGQLAIHIHIPGNLSSLSSMTGNLISPREVSSKPKGNFSSGQISPLNEKKPQSPDGPARR